MNESLELLHFCHPSNTTCPSLLTCLWLFSDLLEETEKLMAEKVEVQRQAQKESGELLQQVKHLEAELEEQVSRLQELQDTRRAEGDDLRQQIQALEKQLENNRKFMDVSRVYQGLKCVT